MREQAAARRAPPAPTGGSRDERAPPAAGSAPSTWARSTIRSSIVHRSSRVSTISRGLALRRIAVSLSASSRSIRSTSPGSSRSRWRLERLPHGLGEPLGLAAELQHQQRAQRLPGPAHELGQVGAGVGQAVDQRKHALGPAVGDEAQHLGVELVAHQAEHLAHPRRGDGALAEAQALVEHAERVAHAAVGVPGDERERVVVRRDPLGLEHLPQPVADGGRADPPEVEALEPREHRRRGGGDLLRLGGGEDEHHAAAAAPRAP